jgi:hypothetical protein
MEHTIKVVLFITWEVLFEYLGVMKKKQIRNNNQQLLVLLMPVGIFISSGLITKNSVRTILLGIRP